MTTPRRVEVLCGDAREALAAFPDGHFHCVVTSPPYWGLRDYGLGPDSLGLEPTPELYIRHLVEIFQEVQRTLRDDGTLWVNIGDRYVGSYKGQHGYKPKDLIGIPWLLAFALRADGWYLRADIIWHKPNVMPESVRDRPTKAHEYVFLLSKSKRYYYDHEAIQEPVTASARKCGRNSRANVDRDVAHGTHKQDAIKLRHYLGFNDRYDFGNPSRKRNCRSVWHIATQPYPDAHFAVFPEKLVERCILAGCPKDGTVLDPFAGSGTVGVVAQKFNRNAILIDAQPEYVKLAMRRCGLLGIDQPDGASE